MKNDHISLLMLNDYVEAIKLLIEQNKTHIKGIQTKLADHIGIRQAYLSRVLSRSADLNQEQILSVGLFFDLDTSEKDFLVNLLNLNRAATKELKAYYQDKINSILSRHHNLNNRLEKTNTISEESKSIYYSDWIYSGVHTMTAISHFQSVNEIAKTLNTPKERILEVLTFLTSIGLVTKRDGLYIHSFANLHLSSESPYIRNHHTNWRLKSIDDISKNKNKSMHYTSVVSCSEADFKEIQEIMVSAIKKIREKVKGSKDEKVYCYSMDAFEII